MIDGKTINMSSSTLGRSLHLDVAMAAMELLLLVGGEGAGDGRTWQAGDVTRLRGWQPATPAPRGSSGGWPSRPSGQLAVATPAQQARDAGAWCVGDVGRGRGPRATAQVRAYGPRRRARPWPEDTKKKAYHGGVRL
jgi:hypothetical protein